MTRNPYNLFIQIQKMKREKKKKLKSVYIKLTHTNIDTSDMMKNVGSIFNLSLQFTFMEVTRQYNAMCVCLPSKIFVKVNETTVESTTTTASGLLYNLYSFNYKQTYIYNLFVRACVRV